jgi:hypothetical protein
MQVMAPAPEPWSTDGKPLGIKLQFWTPEIARYEFLTAFHQLSGEARQ